MNVEPLLLDTYLAVIKNSLGSSMFKNAYALVDGEKKDIVEGGELSCAFFASTILLMFRLIKEIHVTVRGTERDLLNSGWTLITEPKIGSVLVWKACLPVGKEDTAGNGHPHIGFCIGENRAISNSSRNTTIEEHDIDAGGRELSAIYWHSTLG